jgi:hypothetical protein
VITMSKRLSVCLCLVLPLIACTTTKPAGLAAPTFKPTATGPTPGCVPLTASRLAPTAADCAGFGRTYSGDDIRSTGAPDPATALQQLDPTVKFGH